MNANARHIAFLRPVRGCTEKTQEFAARQAGAHVVYSDREVTGQWIVHQAPEPPIKGKGITIYVYTLALLADENYVQLSRLMAEVVASHSVIVETATGLRSDIREQRRIMLEFAAQSIKLRRRARLPAGIVKKGRRAGEFSDEAMAEARRVWSSKKYASDIIAAEHLPEGMTITQARTRFKSSGRQPGRKPRKKRKT